jgi:hypothetical protein
MRLSARLPAFVTSALVVILFSSPSRTQTQERPLPPLEPFLKEVRQRLQPDDLRSRAYVYTYTQRRTKLDGELRAQSTSVRVAESYPGFGPGEPRWERVIEEDGKPVSDAELRRKDLERQREAESYARRMQREDEKAKVVREQAKEQRELDEILDDAERVYEIRMIGRESVDGHGTIVLSLTPRPAARTQTRPGGWLRAFKGRVWIEESEHELVKLEVEAVDDISMAMGLLARLNKGTTLSFARRKVNGEEWLPSRADYRFSARILLLRRFRESVSIEFTNYRKFSVDTRTTISAPQSQD